MTHPYRLLCLALAAAAALAAGCALADFHDHDEDSLAGLREIAAKRVYWRAHGRPGRATRTPGSR